MQTLKSNWQPLVLLLFFFYNSSFITALFTSIPSLPVLSPPTLASPTRLGMALWPALFSAALSNALALGIASKTSPVWWRAPL